MFDVVEMFDVIVEVLNVIGMFDVEIRVVILDSGQRTAVGGQQTTTAPSLATLTVVMKALGYYWVGWADVGVCQAYC